MNGSPDETQLQSSNRADQDQPDPGLVGQGSYSSLAAH